MLPCLVGRDTHSGTSRRQESTDGHLGIQGQALVEVQCLRLGFAYAGRRHRVRPWQQELEPVGFGRGRQRQCRRLAYVQARHSVQPGRSQCRTAQLLAHSPDRRAWREASHRFCRQALLLPPRQSKASHGDILSRPLRIILRFFRQVRFGRQAGHGPFGRPKPWCRAPALRFCKRQQPRYGARP